MAHTDLSNGLSTKFNDFTAAKYWKALFSSRFGKLRLNFGHLGGFEDTSVNDWIMSPDGTPGDVDARNLVSLMSADPTAAGGRFYGDSGYSELILTNSGQVQKVFGAALMWKAAGQTQPLLSDRLMYGSDWSLLMRESDMRMYFEDFVKMYSALDPTGRLSGRFSGQTRSST